MTVSDPTPEGTADGPDVAALLTVVLSEHRLTTPVQCACGWRETDPLCEGTWVGHAAAAIIDTVNASHPKSHIYDGRTAGTLIDGYLEHPTPVDEDDDEDDDEFIQCPHELIWATCAGICNCPCDPCAPSRPGSTAATEGES